MIIAQNVEMNKAKLLSQLEILSTLFTDDYYKNDRNRNDGSNYSIRYEFGSKYIKIIKHYWGSSSVAGFIVNSHNAKFPYGTLLKAASYKAPALNFSRGNIFELQNRTFAWTGIN